MKIKGTFHGDPRAEKLLNVALKGIREEIAVSSMAKSIRAVVLGGSYGRGEGGATPDGALCNDLDFFIVVPHFAPRRKIAALFHEIGKKWSATLNIDVDFAFPQTLDDFERKASTLMVKDLLMAHLVIFGDPNCFTDITRCPWEDLPFFEGMRLLLNRGTGILLAEQRLQLNTGNIKDQEFIERNLHKAALGCGDALLIARHALLGSGIERQIKLDELEMPPKLCSAYSEALEYKYCPTYGDLEKLLSWLTSSKKLFFETVENFFALTADPWPLNSRAHYARANFRDRKKTFSERLRNFILNMLYLRKLPNPLLVTVAPQMKIFAMLIDSLKNTTDDDLHKRYLELWQRFN